MWEERDDDGVTPGGAGMALIKSSFFCRCYCSPTCPLTDPPPPFGIPASSWWTLGDLLGLKW